MFQTFVKRMNVWSDVKTVGALAHGAEEWASRLGEERPGEEHFLLAAMDLKDGAARRVFAEFGVATDSIARAIDQQHADALKSVGISEETNVAMPISGSTCPPRPIYSAQPNVGQFMRELQAVRTSSQSMPLTSLHVLQVLVRRQRGTVFRTLRRLGIGGKELQVAIDSELNRYNRRKAHPHR